MEGEPLNLISNPKEGSGSNSSSNLFRPNKRQRGDNPTSSTRFKGVVLQQNGHWGAQIYANHQRIWLGTFKSEKAAAMAYDSAAIKLQRSDSHRNFPWTSITIQEPNFQDHLSTESVLNMIKDGSYKAKLADYVRSQLSNMAKEARFDLRSGRVEEGGVSYQQLFQKELTPSDVGKLNRLVIPKKYATRYFPQVSEESTVGEGGPEGFQLVFFDRTLRSWKLRYCYWKSSQSYVFTRGWSRFVKEKELKAKDLITFYKCDYVGFKEEKSFCMIDVSYSGGESEGAGVVEGFGDWGKGTVELKLELGLGFECEYDGELEEEEEVVVKPVAKKAVKLFGVEIS